MVGGQFAFALAIFGVFIAANVSKTGIYKRLVARMVNCFFFSLATGGKSAIFVWRTPLIGEVSASDRRVDAQRFRRKVSAIFVATHWSDQVSNSESNKIQLILCER